MAGVLFRVLSGSGKKDKAELRRELKSLRRSLGSEARALASARAVRALADSKFLEGVHSIALYAPLPEEANPLALEAIAAERGIRVAYPRVEGYNLAFVVATALELTPRGPLGIREPRETGPGLALEAIDLVVVPGLGFTRHGQRLGYGRGFYDRALKRARAFSPALRAVGFAFACQVVDALVSVETDEPVDGIATEEGIIVIDAALGPTV